MRGTRMDRSYHRNQMSLVVFAAILWLLADVVNIPGARAQSAAPAGEGPTNPDATAGQPDVHGRKSINVVVVDKLGHPVRGLQASDFTLLDNKEPQKLLGFQAVEGNSSSAGPVHVVIVVDNINTGFGAVAWQREQLNEFLKEDSGVLRYPTTLGMLSESGLKLQKGSTTDGNALLADFNKYQTDLRLINRNAGIYGLADMLEMSLSQLGQLAAFEATEPGHKLILVISPGWPMLPAAGDQEDLVQRNWVFNTIVEMTNGLREANITLYALNPFELGRTDPFYYQGYLKPVALAKNAEYPNLALQVFAAHSGGQVLVAGRDIKGELNTAIRDASTSYELTFEGAPGDRPNEYNALQVQVDKPDVKVRTTAGYYANVRLSTQSSAKKTAKN